MKYVFLRFPEGKAKALTLSYDDGCKDDVRFLETIDQYGLKCTFNLVGTKVERGKPLSADFIRENILAKGHEIATHGYNHRAQNKIRSIEGIREIIDCRIALEREFGMIIRGMAFPDNVVNRFLEPDAYARIKNYLVDLEIAYVRSAAGDNDKFELPEDWHNWIPTAHHDNPRIMEYIDKFVELDVSKLYCASRTPKLFYMWGHSFEFDRNNNWDVIEKFGQIMSEQNDIWHATNMEIYNYVKAFESLVFSSDFTMVHNPTATDVYLYVRNKNVLVKSGETVSFG